LDLLDDPKFATNPDRVRNRGHVTACVAEIIKRQSSTHWIEGLEKAGVSCCPINTVDQVFDDPGVQAREMKISMPHPLAGEGAVDLIGNPIKMSETPAAYNRSPPTMGQHTDEVLEEMLGLSEDERDKLRAAGLI
jgi:crotonobetainyl-CoA:carnitine CoA-transferase CaiB-like acyl-CoA transferase